MEPHGGDVAFVPIQAKRYCNIDVNFNLISIDPHKF